MTSYIVPLHSGINIEAAIREGARRPSSHEARRWRGEREQTDDLRRQVYEAARAAIREHRMKGGTI